MSATSHDGWRRYLAIHRELLAETGLPAKILDGEHHFRRLLTDGEAQTGGVTARLTDLSEPQWSALERFADDFFTEFESWAPLDLFLAFREEVRRRRTGSFVGFQYGSQEPL